MRAADTPGGIATRIASTSAPTTTMMIWPRGTDGNGTAKISRAKRVHNQRPNTIPSGTPTTIPTVAATDACPRHGGQQLSPGDAESLEQREVPPAPSHRRCESQAERRHRAGRQSDGQQCGRRTGRAVVHDDS